MTTSAVSSSATTSVTEMAMHHRTETPNTNIYLVILCAS
jgi:hypothetical protein